MYNCEYACVCLFKRVRVSVCACVIKPALITNLMVKLRVRRNRGIMLQELSQMKFALNKRLTRRMRNAAASSKPHPFLSPSELELIPRRVLTISV